MMTLLDILTLGLASVPRFVLWVGRTIAEEASREYLDEGKLRAELLQLQERYDAGELSDEEYDEQEQAILDRLNEVRELKARYGP